MNINFGFSETVSLKKHELLYYIVYIVLYITRPCDSVMLKVGYVSPIICNAMLQGRTQDFLRGGGEFFSMYSGQ